MRLLPIRRRGEGTYQKVDAGHGPASRAHELPFGVSICYTSVNSDSVTRGGILSIG